LKHSVPKKIVLIGASTGGPGQIKKIITSLPVLQETSIVIAQHMADGFLESFVSTLNQNKTNRIEITKDTKELITNTIYVCQKSVTVEKEGDYLFFKEQKHKNSSFNPDINMVFNSFAYLKQIEILTVILTGIGNDGIEACSKLSSNGMKCITETSQSAIIDGMPGRAREYVPNIKAYDMQEIIRIICEFCA
jgi:two-component system chemotaxis response regulator CheB